MVELATVVPRVDDRDWSGLTLGEMIRQIEVEGYLLIPDLLSEEQIARLKEQVSTLETGGMDYSEHQRTAGDVMFLGGEITELAAHPVIIPFLRSLLGEDIICTSGAYARSEPGHPGMVLHTDSGGDGAPSEAVRVLYYLTDLTPETSPFRVLPRSNLSMHSGGNPFKRYLEHPDEVMVTAKAGSAVLINIKVFHGNYPNKSDPVREMIAYMYRPGWCGPGKHMEPWDPDKLWPSCRRTSGSCSATLTPTTTISLEVTGPPAWPTTRPESVLTAGTGDRTSATSCPTSTRTGQLMP